MSPAEASDVPLVPPFVLDPASTVPLYRQLEDQLRSSIADGRVAARTRLPSIRDLARDLRLARVTVASAYADLVAEGYLITRIGSGTRVAATLPDEALYLRRSHPAHPARPRPDRTEVRLSWPRRLDLSPLPLPARTPDDVQFDFRPDAVGVDLFPSDIWERLLREAWRALAGIGGRGLGYRRSPVGNAELRAAIVNYVGMARGIRADPEQIVVTGGRRGAMSIISRLLPARARCVVPDPGSPAVRRALEFGGATLLAVPAERHGLRIEELPSAAEACVVMPSWQHPLGGTMTAARRLELLAWAHRVGAIIIEDDYDHEFRYVGHPTPSLLALDDGSHVIYVATFAKSLFPGLRLGFAIVPRASTTTFHAAVEADGEVPELEQLTLARFISRGHYERHLRRLREAYRQRQETLLAALERHCRGLLAADPVDAGTWTVVHLLDQRLTARMVQRTARADGVFLGLASAARIRPAADHELLVGFAGQPPERIEEGVRLLGGILRSGAIRAAAATAQGSTRGGGRDGHAATSHPARAGL
jgi:GntR family transcriptional regulator/MocR family aminotransferase